MPSTQPGQSTAGNDNKPPRGNPIRDVEAVEYIALNRENLRGLANSSANVFHGTFVRHEMMGPAPVLLQPPVPLGIAFKHAGTQSVFDPQATKAQLGLVLVPGARTQEVADGGKSSGRAKETAHLFDFFHLLKAVDKQIRELCRKLHYERLARGEVKESEFEVFPIVRERDGYSPRMTVKFNPTHVSFVNKFHDTLPIDGSVDLRDYRVQPWLQLEDVWGFPAKGPGAKVVTYYPRVVLVQKTVKAHHAPVMSPLPPPKPVLERQTAYIGE